jgi:2-hydroxychromene-2-carboxylate isomerase
MNSTEAIAALKAANTARLTSDKLERLKANRAFKIAARALWNAWKNEGHPDHVTEVLNAYGIDLA